MIINTKVVKDFFIANKRVQNTCKDFVLLCAYNRNKKKRIHHVMYPLSLFLCVRITCEFQVPSGQ